MNHNTSKVLFFGSSNGNFKKIFEKTHDLNKKHNFDFLFCIGDFLPESGTDELEIIDLLEGRIQIPITTYFSIGKQRLHKKVEKKAIKNNGEICKNLFYIGKLGTLTTSKGIKISCLGGMYEEKQFYCKILPEDTEIKPYIYESEVDFIMKKGKDSDILVTFEWPKDIHKFSCKKMSKMIPGVQSIAKVTSYIQPKYHFSSNGSIFYEREPYKNISIEDRQKTNITRFISLGSLDNPDKERSSYAFNITASSLYDTSNTLNIPNVTRNPFTEEINTNSKEIKHNLEDSQYTFFWNKESSNSIKRQKHDTEISKSYDHIIKKEKKETNSDQVPQNCIQIHNITDHLIYNSSKLNKEKYEKESTIPPNYTCKICMQKGHWIQNCPQKKTTASRKPIRNHPKLEFCFFCLSDPRIARHLITSIGSETYLALPKGPLTTSSTNSPSLSFPGHVLIIPIAHVPTINAIEEVNRDKTKEEMERYRISINEMFKSKGCDTVAFEISRINGIHLHWQVIPIKKNLSDELENTFISMGNEKKYNFEKRDIKKDEENYLRIWLPNNTILVHIIKPETYFDLKFARYVISKVLNLEERSDWKNCVQTNEQEFQDSIQFKKHFKDFDFTI
ncbi:hypothetical protein PNEG_02376 [Pneumocystis murina B123]|uniref:CCHC-type domain-containing protein n=1 Tax=Pneumocystis murina (strain B123) TaxID=1069680 RepID=M7NL91_PNEMU|nr:hypothetical protein PNEG_02376 [Pneumocystis murina B123]EMR09433.1 hypothetical protein PNEG_02376 [Pneumocystis murina B123]